MKALLEAAFTYTIFTFRFTPEKNFLSLVVYITVNTLIRAAAVYGTIRLVLTALSHGSF